MLIFMYRGRRSFVILCRYSQQRSAASFGKRTPTFSIGRGNVEDPEVISANLEVFVSTIDYRMEVPAQKIRTGKSARRSRSLAHSSR